MSETPELLRPYQFEDLVALIRDERFALLHDPGCGKTPPICLWFWWLWNDHKQRSVWTMPLGLLRKNKAELLRFTHFKEEDVAIVEGPPKRRRALMQSDAKVFLMGFDCFAKNWEFLLKAHPDLNAHGCDEIHKAFGHNNSKRTQSLYIAMRHIKRFAPMTGTLVNGRLDTVYPTIHIIEPRYYASYQDFLNQHAVLDYWGSIIGWKNHDKIKAILARHSHRKSFEEVYGKEAKVVIVEKCEMSPQQRAKYDEFEEKALLELEDKFLDGTLPGVATIRCRQIMQCPEIHGIAMDEMTGKDQLTELHLLDALANKMKFGIFSVFHPEQERLKALAEKIGLKVGLINSNVSSAKRGKVDEALQAGEIDGIVASSETAGFGYNWDMMDMMVFPSLDYQDSSFMQAYRRAIRGVRKKNLLIYVQEYLNSVDQRIFQIVDMKTQDANKVDGTREVYNLGAAA